MEPADLPDVSNLMTAVKMGIAEPVNGGQVKRAKVKRVSPDSKQNGRCDEYQRAG